MGICLASNPETTSSYFYGLVSLANWATTVLLDLKLFPPPKYQINVLAVMISEISIALKPKFGQTYVNIFGLHSGLSFVGSVFGGVFWAIAVVIGDIDPVNFVLYALTPIFGELPVLVYSTITTFTLVGCVSAQAAVSLIKYLKQMDISFPNIQLYRDVFVGCCLIREIFKHLNSLFLSGAFFGLLLATNLTIFGGVFIPGYLYVACPFLALLLLWCIMLLLHFESMVNDTTQKILKTWKSQLSTTTRKRYFKLVLKSLRPIAIPVGNIGVVDRDIQMNYMNAYLVYVANTSIVFQGVLSV